MQNSMLQHDDADLDYDIDCRSMPSARIAFNVAPTSRRKTQARYARKSKPALKGASGMHRRANKRYGV